MAALTKNRSTPERIATLRQFEAAGEIYAGALVANALRPCGSLRRQEKSTRARLSP